MKVILRRYKKLLLTFTLMLTFSFAIFFGGTKANDSNASTVKEKYFTCIAVEDGDTLWSIADEYATVEFKSHEAFIAEVKHINNLTGDKIYAGGSLVIPIYK